MTKYINQYVYFGNVKTGIYLKIISIACGISAIILISIAIASPNGITYYEDRMPVKIFEVVMSSIAVIYLLNDLETTLINLLG